MASQEIGSLFVSLGLDTATFTAGVKQATGRVERFANDLSKRLGGLADMPGISRLQGVLASVGAGAGAALGAAAAAATVGLGAMSVSSINAAAELKNLSALANATPEEFQKLAYAAKSVGIEQDKLSDILKDMNDRIGDFISTGGGPMKDFFQTIAPRVGVTAEQFRNLSGPQALQLYVKSLEDANVNQQDFAFFMEAIASDSTALVPILRNGGASAKAYADRLEALGGVMSNDTVARLAGMKTKLSEVGVVISGMVTQLGAAAAPAVAALAGAFVSLFTKGSLLRGIIDAISVALSFTSDLFAAVVNIIGEVVSSIWSLVVAFGSWLNSVTGIGAALTWLWDHGVGFVADMIIGFSDILDATGGIGGAFALLGEVASGVWEGIKTSAASIPVALSGLWESVKAGFLRALGAMQERWLAFLSAVSSAVAATPFLAESGVSGAIDAAIGDAMVGLSEFDAAAQAAETRAANLKAEAGRMASEGFDKAAAALGKLNVATVDTTSSMTGSGGTGLAPALADTGSKAGGAKSKLEGLAKVMSELQLQAQKLAATLGMSELDANIWEKQRAAGVSAASIQGQQIAAIMRQINGMERLKSATEAWRDSLSSAFSQFITQGGSFRDVLSSIIGKLAEMLANSAFESLWNGIGGNRLASGFLSIFGIGNNANGTNDWRGGLTRVNERGGEVMNLPRGTQVIPHDISKRMADQAGGGAVEIIVRQEPGTVAEIARNEAGAAVRLGLEHYDTQVLPLRMRKISSDPRKIG